MKESLYQASALNQFCVINIFFFHLIFLRAFLRAALPLKTKTNTDNWINHHAAPATLWGKCCTVAMESSVARQWVDYHSFYIRGRAVFSLLSAILSVFFPLRIFGLTWQSSPQFTSNFSNWVCWLLKWSSYIKCKDVKMYTMKKHSTGASLWSSRQISSYTAIEIEEMRCLLDCELLLLLGTV